MERRHVARNRAGPKVAVMCRCGSNNEFSESNRALLAKKRQGLAMQLAIRRRVLAGLPSGQDIIDPTPVAPEPPEKANRPVIVKDIND